MTDTSQPPLPSGLHPQDKSFPAQDWNPAASDEQAPSTRRAAAPFSVDPGRAVAVFQRAAKVGIALTYNLNGTEQIVNRQVGRVLTYLWVPSSVTVSGSSSTPNGVQWSFNRDYVDSGNGVPLNAGDAISVPCEAPIYAGPQTGNTTGIVYLVDLYNPPTILGD